MIKDVARWARDVYRRRVFRSLVRRVVENPVAAMDDRELLERISNAWGNGPWTASTDYLQTSMSLARAARGPILECGSGLSTILVAAATRGTGRPVITLEHSGAWARRVGAELDRAGLGHARVAHSPLKSTASYDWYSVPEPLPHGLSLVLCDGPPGTTRGGRSGLVPEIWNLLSSDVVILLDDASRDGEQAAVASWTAQYPLVAHVDETARNPYATLRRSS